MDVRGGGPKLEEIAMTTDNNFHTKLHFADPCDARQFRAALAERVADLGEKRGAAADWEDLAAAVAAALADLPASHEARLCGPGEVTNATVTSATLSRELFETLPAWARADCTRLRPLRGVADRTLRRALAAEGFIELPESVRGAFSGAPFVHHLDLRDLVDDARRYGGDAALEGPDALRDLADAIEWASARLGDE